MLYRPLVAFNLWWRQNDGIGGHAWLSEDDMRAVTDEMRAQGVVWDPVRPYVTAIEIDDALRAVAATPRTYVDPKLWTDWLAFLDGARENGGIVIRYPFGTRGHYEARSRKEASMTESQGMDYPEGTPQTEQRAGEEAEGREATPPLPSEENPLEPDNAAVPPEESGPSEETGPSPSPGRPYGGGVARGGTPGGGSAAT